MQPVIADFISWFGRFVLVSSIAMVVAHLAARWQRNRKALRDVQPQPVTGGMRPVRPSR